MRVYANRGPDAGQRAHDPEDRASVWLRVGGWFYSLTKIISLHAISGVIAPNVSSPIGLETFRMELRSILRAPGNSLTYGIWRLSGPYRRQSGLLCPPHRRHRSSSQQLGARTCSGAPMGSPARGPAPGRLTGGADDRARGGGVSLARNSRRPAQRPARRARCGHTGQGDRPENVTRVSAAYEQARSGISTRRYRIH